MRKRLSAEILIGILLIGCCIWWFYFRASSMSPLLMPDAPVVKCSIGENRNRILVIGIDGMTWNVALDLINAGRMPNLTRIFSRGPHGTMMSESPLISPAIWTTIATGHSRNIHGIDNFITRIESQYSEVNMTSSFRKVPALWNIVSESGRRVCVVNWNPAYPAEAINGIFIAHGISPKKKEDEMIYPHEWRNRIRALTPVRFNKIESSLNALKGSQAWRAYDLDRFVYTVSKEILVSEQPDLMMVYFPGTDIVSHLYWKYRWPMSMKHFFQITFEERHKYRNIIENHYEFTDALIGGLLKESEGYTIMIVSDHGSGPNYPPHNYYLNVNHLLEHLGYLAYKDRSCENILVEMALQGVLSIPAPISVNIYRLAQALMAEAQKHQKLNGKPFSTGAIAAWLQQKAGKNGKAISIQSQYLQALAKSLKPGGVGTDIDWESTSAWNVEDLRKNKQGIFINLKGREKSGVVLPNEYKTFKKQLIQVFKKLVTDKGRPLFNTVEAGQEEIYESPGRIALPDIKVEVNRGALSDNLIFKGKNDPDPIPLTNVLWIYKEGSGDHIREGVFLLAGAHAASFRRIDISLYDIAPTILWALGFPVGADMPGRIISEAFSDSMAGRKKMLIESWTGITKSETITDIVTTDEKQLEQLRSLGYVR